MQEWLKKMEKKENNAAKKYEMLKFLLFRFHTFPLAIIMQCVKAVFS